MPRESTVSVYPRAYILLCCSTQQISNYKTIRVIRQMFLTWILRLTQWVIDIWDVCTSHEWALQWKWGFSWLHFLELGQQHRVVAFSATFAGEITFMMKLYFRRYNVMVNLYIFPYNGRRMSKDIFSFINKTPISPTYVHGLASNRGRGVLL